MIAADARRRRLTTLVNAAYLGRTTPAVYVVEDVHWIDSVSESMLADFLSVVARTHSLVLTTYRPEYRGALSQIPGGQTIFLAPLEDSQTVSLVTELLGAHPSVVELVAPIAERAAGNPFFAESIVRDLADREVVAGARGDYVCTRDHADITVPATLQAAIAARIDRLDADAKHTLCGCCWSLTAAAGLRRRDRLPRQPGSLPGAGNVAGFRRACELGRRVAVTNAYAVGRQNP